MNLNLVKSKQYCCRLKKSLKSKEVSQDFAEISLVVKFGFSPRYRTFAASALVIGAPNSVR